MSEAEAASSSSSIARPVDGSESSPNFIRGGEDVISPRSERERHHEHPQVDDDEPAGSAPDDSGSSPGPGAADFTFDESPTVRAIREGSHFSTTEKEELSVEDHAPAPPGNKIKDLAAQNLITANENLEKLVKVLFEKLKVSQQERAKAEILLSESQAALAESEQGRKKLECQLMCEGLEKVQTRCLRAGFQDLQTTEAVDHGPLPVLVPPEVEVEAAVRGEGDLRPRSAAQTPGGNWEAESRRQHRIGIPSSSKDQLQLPGSRGGTGARETTGPGVRQLPPLDLPGSYHAEQAPASTGGGRGGTRQAGAPAPGAGGPITDIIVDELESATIASKTDMYLNKLSSMVNDFSDELMEYRHLHQKLSGG